MAIAPDTTTTPAGTTGTSYTYSHTCSGSNRALVLGVIGAVGSDLITGATYNGISMMLVKKVLVPGDRYNYMFVLGNPDTGANNIVISASSSSDIIPGSASYTGVKQLTQAYEGATTNTGSGVTSFSTTVLNHNQNAWGVSTFRSANTVTPIAGTTTRLFYQGGTFSGICDTNGPMTRLSSVSLGYTSVSSNWAMIMIILIPDTANSLQDGLVEYFNLNGSSAGAVSGNNGTDTAIAYSTANGKIAQGAGFNGSTSYISSASSAFAFAGPLTVGCWVNPSSLPTSGNIMSLASRFTNTAGQFGWDLRLRNNAGTQVIQFSSDTLLAQATITLSLNTWYFIAAVSDGDTNLYVGTAPLGFDFGQIAGIATNSLYLGAIDYNAGVQRFFSGKMGLVGIWNRGLSQSNLTEIVNNGVGMQDPFGESSGSQIISLI